MIPNKPRFVDLGDEGGKLLLEGERGQGYLDALYACLIDCALASGSSNCCFDLSATLRAIHKKDQEYWVVF